MICPQTTWLWYKWNNLFLNYSKLGSSAALLYKHQSLQQERNKYFMIIDLERTVKYWGRHSSVLNPSTRDLDWGRFETSLVATLRVKEEQHHSQISAGADQLEIKEHTFKIHHHHTHKYFCKFTLNIPGTLLRIPQIKIFCQECQWWPGFGHRCEDI